MNRRTAGIVGLAAAAALIPASGVVAHGGGSGPQGTLVICHEGQTLTIAAADWWPYGYAGATKGECPTETPTPTPTEEPTPTPTEEPTETPTESPTPPPEETPTETPTPEPTATERPERASRPRPPVLLAPPATVAEEPTPVVTPYVIEMPVEETPAPVVRASSTYAVPQPASTGHGVTEDEAHASRWFAGLLAVVSLSSLAGAIAAAARREVER